MLRPLIEAAGPVADLFGTYSYTEFQRMIDDPPGFRNWWTAEYVNDLRDAAIEALCAYGETIPPGYSQLLVAPWRGAVAVPDGATPLANRDAACVIHPFTLWTEPERDPELVAWGRRVRGIFAPWTTGGTYLNFIGDEGEERVRAAFGGSYERLLEVKAAWDPDNVFSGNHNIGARGPGARRRRRRARAADREVAPVVPRALATGRLRPHRSAGLRRPVAGEVRGRPRRPDRRSRRHRPAGRRSRPSGSLRSPEISPATARARDRSHGGLRHGALARARRRGPAARRYDRRASDLGETMECDVAVLGGGPGGYTAAIRAAQLGAKAVCIERAEALGGTCLRVGCIPTKAWVCTAVALKVGRETFAKLGVQVSEPQLDFAAANEWKTAVVKQVTNGVAFLFKANGVEWVQGEGRFTDANTIAVEGAGDVTFRSAIVATGSYPIRPPIPGLDSPRCVDSTGLLAQSEVPRRLVILGGGVIGCEFASIFRHFGSEVTIIEMLPSLIPMEDDDASKELAKQFGRRGIALHLGKQCTQVDDTGSGLVVHFGEGETVEADLMLVSVGRAPLVDGIGLEQAGVEFDRRQGIAADERRRTSVQHVYAVGDCAGYWQLAHTAFREGEVAAENALGHDAVVDNRGVPRPIYTDPEIAAVGLTEAQAREQYGDDVAVGSFPWVANARAVMMNDTVGWVKSIHETRYGELLGLVIVGPDATDLIDAGVVALDAEATVETVADGMAPHPTLAEAVKEAGLVALGRAIHLPNRRRAAAPT
jgi:dihydrolipoamide dehydrogenase